MSANSQGVHGDFQLDGQFFSTHNFLVFLTFVISENEFSTLNWQAFETIIKTMNARFFARLFRVNGRDCLRSVFNDRCCFLFFFQPLHKNESRGFIEICHQVLDRLSFIDSPHHSIERFVHMMIGRIATAPFEESQ